MRLIQQIPESEFIREFLAADYASPHGDKSQCVRDDLASKGLSESVLMEGPAPSPEAAALRAILVDHCHGRTLNGLPLAETTWYRAELLASDLLYLMDLGDFRSWTKATLRPQDAIQGFRDNPERSFDAVVARVRSGQVLPPLICVAREESAPAVVLDGSQRATVQAELSTPRPVPILLGLSPRMGEWVFFPRGLIRPRPASRQ